MKRLRSLPRDQWPDHPHWPTQTLLLGSHRDFRFISRRLVVAARAGEELDWIHFMIPRWIGAMRSHEAYEERKLYPYLVRRWSLSFDRAEAGHRQLHDRGRAVRQALATMESAGEPSDAAPALADALEVHDVVLCEHLDHEEDLVIPALLELS
ncbi:MAG: hemerythrin domain-containing protein, partial [Myxococcales bacterium]|nr:hemerythrin domain-containing protein [Myxococcales bacterium]